MSGPYEQIETDLGYLQLRRSAEVFAPLADEARTHDWTHVEYLARLLAEETTATRDWRLAARLRCAEFPFRRTIDDFDFEIQSSIGAGYRGHFTAAQDMCEHLVAAKADGTWNTELTTCTAPTVLVVDDVGLLPMPDRRASAVFFQVVDARYEGAAPHHRHHQPRTARLGRDLRRQRRRRHPRSPHAPRRRVQHPRAQLAPPRTPRPRDRHHQPRPT